MFESLVGALKLLLDFVVSGRSMYLDAKKGCKLLTKCYCELDELVIISKRLVIRLGDLLMAQRTDWSQFLTEFEKELGVFNKALEGFLQAYEDIDNALVMHDPELARFTRKVFHIMKQIYARTISSWFDEKSLTADEQKLRLRIVKITDKVIQKKPLRGEDIEYVDWEMDVSTPTGKQKVVKQAQANLADLVTLKEQMRQFIAAHCTVNDIL